MTLADWVSCSIAFLALLVSIPGGIHTIKSRLKISVTLLKMQKCTHGDKFAYYFDLFIANNTTTPISILSLEILSNSEYKKMVNQFGINVKILLDNKMPTVETSFYLGNEIPDIKNKKVKIKINTNLKSFKIGLSVSQFNVF